MAQRILRPLDYGGLFDELFDLYKKNFVLFVGIAGIIYVPLSILTVILSAPISGISPGQLPDLGRVAGLLVVILISVPLSYAVSAATTWAVSSTYLGSRPTIANSYQAILPRLLPFILTGILTGIAIAVGFVLCCIPGIIAGILLAFVPVVMVIEDCQYIDAMKRSWDLAKSDWARVFVVLLVTVILGAILQGILTFPFQMASAVAKSGAVGPLTVLNGIMQGIAQTLVIPITTIALVLLYYDVRVRKEGFDVQMLALNMGQAPPPTPVQPEQPVQPSQTEQPEQPEQQ